MGLKVTAKRVQDGPHRFTALTVNELSLVTEPAILSQQESDDGVGFPVIKNVNEVMVPGAIKKSITPKEGEDYFEAISRLIAACKLQAMVDLNDGDLYWMDAIKVGSNTVTLADYWGDPFSDDYTIYECSYVQEGDTFKITEVKPLKIKWVPAAEAAPAEAGGDMPPPDAEKAAVVPDETTKTVETPAAVETPAPAVEAPAAVAAEVPATKNLSGLFSVEHMLQLSQGTGKTYRAIITEAGVTYEPVADVAPIPMIAAKSVEAPAAVEAPAPSPDSELVAKIAELQAENLKLKQLAVPAVDPAVAEANQAATQNTVAKNFAPGLHPAAGIFTTGIFRN